jgi:hypothetical protein
MKEFLKGNYKVDAVIKESEAEAEAGATEAFERKALSRLGGSICFVSKKSFIWEGDMQKGEVKPKASRADTEDGTAKARQAGGAAAAGKATTKTTSRADTEDGTAKARQD